MTGPEEVVAVARALASSGGLDHCITPYDVKAEMETICMRELIGYRFQVEHGPGWMHIKIIFGFDCPVPIASINRRFQ